MDGEREAVEAAPGDELATDYEGPDQELVPGLMTELVTRSCRDVMAGCDWCDDPAVRGV
ncbi:hypothetical protein [Streptomyces abikoensis]|uniref:hypothetical protein n=1 Tax=Streptomyces abikoensis TaxID=97398 RepID=UPI0016794EBD|nr:hypothetical protein [Streptomyces abikoensis]GGP46546.1 hypothetical protein GCM10010214_19560 [Streptomyces abikoensis]